MFDFIYIYIVDMNTTNKLEWISYILGLINYIKVRLLKKKKNNNNKF